FDLSEFKSVRLMIASRENLNPLACAGNLIASQTRRSFRRCQAEQSEATLSLWAIVIRRFVPGLHSTREDALVTADQSRQDSAGQLSRVSNLSVQIHLTASFVEGGRPLRSADRQNQARSDQQGRTHLWPVRPLLKTADLQRHSYLDRPSAVRTGFLMSWGESGPWNTSEGMYRRGG